MLKHDLCMAEISEAAVERTGLFLLLSGRQAVEKDGCLGAHSNQGE